MRKLVRHGRNNNTNPEDSIVRPIGSDDVDLIVERVGAMFDDRFDGVADDVLAAVHALKTQVSNHERNNAMRHSAIMKALEQKSADELDRDAARIRYVPRQSTRDEYVERLRYRSGDL